RVARGDADDVPGVVVAVLVGRKVRRVVDHPNVDGHAAAAVGVADGHRVRPGRYALKDVAVLERAVVKLVHVGTLAHRRHLDGVAVRKGPVDQYRAVLERRRGYRHRGTD